MMKRSARPPFWLRALGLKMTGYLRGSFTARSIADRCSFRNRIRYRSDSRAMRDDSIRRSQHLKQALHRQPHHIFKTPVDAINDQVAVFLNAVGTRFVERVDL